MTDVARLHLLNEEDVETSENINVGAVGVVKGSPGGDKVVVYFEQQLDNGVIAKADVAVKLDNLFIEKPAPAVADGHKSEYKHLPDNAEIIINGNTS